MYIFIGDKGCPIPPHDGPFLAESTELAVKSHVVLQTMSQTMSQADFCGVNTRSSDVVHFWPKKKLDKTTWSDGVSNYRLAYQIIVASDKKIIQLYRTIMPGSWMGSWAGSVSGFQPSTRPASTTPFGYLLGTPSTPTWTGGRAKTGNLPYFRHFRPN